MKKSGAGSYSTSADCVVNPIDNIITITNRDDIAFPAGDLANNFRINNKVTAPTESGTYLIDITSYDTDGKKILESFSAYVIIASAQLLDCSITSYLMNANAISILDISLTTLNEIPAGEAQSKASDEQGQIEITFSTSSWATNLGTTCTSICDIPCKPIYGIQPSTNT